MGISLWVEDSESDLCAGFEDLWIKDSQGDLAAGNEDIFSDQLFAHQTPHACNSHNIIAESRFQSGISGDDELDETDVCNDKIRRRKTRHSRDPNNYRIQLRRKHYGSLQTYEVGGLFSDKPAPHYNIVIGSSDCDSDAGMKSKEFTMMVKDKVTTDSHYHGLHSAIADSETPMHMKSDQPEVCGQESMVRFLIMIVSTSQLTLLLENSRTHDRSSHQECTTRAHKNYGPTKHLIQNLTAW